MASGGFVEEMMREQSLLEATCGGLFDHIDDLLDFPKDDDVLLLDAPPAPASPLASRIISSDKAAPPPPPPASSAFFDAAQGFDAKDAGHIVPCDELDMDMAQLEWLSGLFDDTSIPHDPVAFPAIRGSALAANAGVAMLPDKMEDVLLFRSSSPISVLEHGGTGAGAFNGATSNKNSNGSAASSASSSSASSSSESFSGSGGSAWSAPDPPVLVIPARARSKRSRASAFTSGARPADAPTILVPTPMYSSAVATSSHSDPESIVAESDGSLAPPPPAMKKKKKTKKPAPAPASSDAEGDDADYEEGGERALPPGTVRRCTHCLIEKTPQWRAGPLGPKTLCNACGVRYKSGRLFPEYRPAASPTFVPAVHSNSHKKVVEMRQKAARSGDPSCDLLHFIRRRD